MSMRTNRQTVIFRRPFLLAQLGRSLPAGAYEVLTDEELIEGLSFPVYRRVATMMLVPALSSRSSIEMVTIDPLELAAGLDCDAAVDTAGSGSTKMP
jgi:hypothetical protein